MGTFCSVYVVGGGNSRVLFRDELKAALPRKRYDAWSFCLLQILPAEIRMKPASAAGEDGPPERDTEDGERKRRMFIG